MSIDQRYSPSETGAVKAEARGDDPEATEAPTQAERRWLRVLAAGGLAFLAVFLAGPVMMSATFAVRDGAIYPEYNWVAALLLGAESLVVVSTVVALRRWHLRLGEVGVVIAFALTGLLALAVASVVVWAIALRATLS
jgi:hypothetical protein